MPYGKSSADSVASAKAGSGSEFWNPPDGESKIRVMPPATEDLEDFWVATGTHFNVGPDERTIPCPQLSGEADSCFLCRLVKRLSRGSDDEKQEAKEISARPRYLISVVDLDEPEAGVQVWPAPVTIFRKLKKFFLNEDDYGDMTDMQDGYNIIIDKEGSGLNTKYDAVPARNNTAFPPKDLLEHRSDAVADLFQQIKDEEFELPDLLAVQSYLTDEEMERAYKGLAERRPREDEEPEDEEPEGEEPEDGEPEEGEEPEEGAESEDGEPEEGAEDGEPEEGEEPEEDPKPSRRSRSRTRAAKKEPEEDPKPSRRRAAKKEPEEDPPRQRRSARKGGAKDAKSRLRGRARGLS